MAPMGPSVAPGVEMATSVRVAQSGSMLTCHSVPLAATTKSDCLVEEEDFSVIASVDHEPPIDTSEMRL